MMSANQKGFPTVVFAFALVTLLSCFSPVSSYFNLPRVSRTSDAIIIDYEGVGYAPFSLGRGYSQVADPGFVPLPAFNPYGMFYGGWPHFGRQISPSAISERAVEGATSTNPRPFLVVLRRSTAAPDVFFCSGTLISNSSVLLAAQCLEQMSVYEISTVTVLVGLRSITPGAATGAPGTPVVQMTRRISRVVIHAQYNAARYANDIAIISLDMPVIFSNNVRAAVLPLPSTDPDQHIDVPTALVMGWGPATAGAASTAFRQGSVAIVANDIDCTSQPIYGVFVTVNNICVSGTGVTAPLIAAYTCAADVGGPVVINTAPPGAPLNFTIVGINSFTPADACATPFRNGLKTRVSAYVAWIATYMA